MPAVLHDVVPPARLTGLPVAGAPLVGVLAVAQGLGLLQRRRGWSPAGRRPAGPRTSWRWRRRRRPCGRRRRRPGGGAARRRGRPSRRSSSSTSGYERGSTTEPTWAQFLAAARTMVGPPTSISSMDGLARNGYRLQTTRPIGSMPWAARSAAWAGLARSARMPPWRRGWRVLTRPPSISGAPGHRLDGGVRDAGIGQGRGRPAAGDQLVPELGQAARRSRSDRSCRTRTAGPSSGGSLLLSGERRGSSRGTAGVRRT